MVFKTDIISCNVYSNHFIQNYIHSSLKPIVKLALEIASINMYINDTKDTYVITNDI